MSRSQNAHSLLELPVGLWLGIVVFFLPFVCYGTAAYRAAFLYESAHRACEAAARAGTFTEGKRTCLESFDKEVACFTGISDSSIKCYAVEQPLPAASGGELPATSQESEQPLKNVKTDKNTYYIKVVAKGNVEPLVRFGADGFLGMKFPGLTAPLPFNPTCSAFVEYPQGLLK
jgi:hypothetical protein